MPKRYALEFRKQVLFACQNGLSIPNVGEKYCIAKSILYRWLKEVELIGNQYATVDYNTLQQKTFAMIIFYRLSAYLALSTKYHSVDDLRY